ncbi:MAG TPA: sll0787 family AIR synthase-like protein [Polyangiaceae bacterium]|nr:sll0787 family AIR synthase-like protein [Polyangiaceae bacterium]
MKLDGYALKQLSEMLVVRAELEFKRDIQLAARMFPRRTRSAWFPSQERIINGDDAAALPGPDGYTLFAAEGMRPEFVAADPWFAGFSSVLVNVNDIAAMGGRPWAVVDVLFLGSGVNERLLEGMAEASAVFGVPVVGGHTTRINAPSALAVAVVGKAKRLISSAAARPGQVLLSAVDLRGSFRGPGGNFNAATTAPGRQLRAQLEVLPELAENALVCAGKDISMAGTCGTLLMLLEASGTGAVLDLARLPAPSAVDPLRWLSAFPSFGFLLSVEPKHVNAVCARFDAVGVVCAPIGELTSSRKLELHYEGESALYWDLAQASLTGFGGAGETE